MNSYDIDTLSNGIKVITRKNANTPRAAINMFMGSGAKYESLSGTASLTSRLLLQGTASRTAEELANELDSNAIEFSVDSKQDFLRARGLCLNEDFAKMVELLEDVIKNSTFENIDKEVMKLTGELRMEMDSPKAQALDNLVKTIFHDHPYGHSYTKVLEDLPSIKIENIKDFYYKECLVPSRIEFSITGDIEKSEVLSILEEKFGSLPQVQVNEIEVEKPEIQENKLVTISQADAAQAQIIQGWIGPALCEEDFPAITLMNVILGASGLSSRLFVELRDKKGLAYHVRSSLEALKHLGLFTVYIGTAPNNIKTCIEGFETEINKLKNELVSEKELKDAKNNYLGKRAFMHETNSQQAYFLGYYDTMGVGVEFDTKIEDLVRKVTSEDVKRVANKYFSQKSVTSILAQEDFIKELSN